MSLFRKKSIETILKNAEAESEHSGLAKHLGVRDLTAFGIAAIIGAGIFSTIGTASADGGPAVIFLFIFTALACGFAAFVLCIIHISICICRCIYICVCAMILHPMCLP